MNLAALHKDCNTNKGRKLVFRRFTTYHAEIMAGKLHKLGAFIHPEFDQEFDILNIGGAGKPAFVMPQDKLDVLNKLPENMSITQKALQLGIPTETFRRWYNKYKELELAYGGSLENR